MKLYAFTEQGLKDLLDKHTKNVIRITLENQHSVSIDVPYPTFPEPIQLPELNDIEILAHKHSIFNKEKWAYISGANHIIELIKNGLK